MSGRNIGTRFTACFPQPSAHARRFLYFCTAAGRTLLPAGGVFSPPANTGIAVIYLEEGSIAAATKGAGTFIGAGMTFLTDCAERPELSAVSDSVFYFVCADGANTRELYDFITSGGSSPFVANSDAKRFCESVSDILKDDHIGHESEISAETHSLLCSLYDSALRRVSGENPSVIRVKSYIENHFSERLSLAKMARMAKLTESEFGEAFRRSTGFTPYDYLLTVRIAAARRLLLDTDMPLKDIAAAVGYRRTGSFSEMFASKTGMSPTEFRKLFYTGNTAEGAE